MPKGLIFVSQRQIYIEEIGPSGSIYLAMLVGKRVGSKAMHGLSQQLGIYGSYVCEAYGATELLKLNKWIPMNVPNEIIRPKR